MVSSAKVKNRGTFKLYYTEQRKILRCNLLAKLSTAFINSEYLAKVTLKRHFLSSAVC